jgi:hypothetical protein
MHMRRILFVFAAALALTALPKMLAAGTERAIPGVSAVLSAGSPSAIVPIPGDDAPSEAEAGEDGDDFPGSIAPSSAAVIPDPAAVGHPHAPAVTIVERDSVSRPLCRGRPPRDPRAMSPSGAPAASNCVVFDRRERLFPADPAPRRLPPPTRL